MDALVMCGGRGTRLAATREKPLVDVGGDPMVDRVVDALLAVDPPECEGIETVHAAVSPNAPRTADHLRDRTEVRTVETPGEGYVADLGVALESIERPVLTVVADLPLLAPDAVTPIFRVWRRAADDDPQSTGPSLTVRVPVALKRRLGASVDDRVVFEDGADDEGCAYLPAGINVVGGGDDDANDANEENMYTTYDARLAVNVNRRTDVDCAEALLCD